MPSYSIERTLGDGFEGRVFLVKNKAGQTFAMKAYRRCDEEKFAIEQEFNKEVVRKYPSKFMRIIQSKNVTITDKDLQHLPEGTCRLVVYETVDRILSNLMSTLPREALYSIMIQIIDAVRVMHGRGYLHGDLHAGNIGLVFTDKDELRLSDKTTVKSCGYQVKIIDYGFVRKIQGKKQDRYYANYEAIWTIKTIICPWNNALWNEEHETYLKNPELNKTMLEGGYDEILSGFSKKHADKITLMKTLFPEEYMKRVFGSYPRRKFKPTLPTEDLIFVLRADKNQDLILRYFQHRLAH